jgi:osmotically-inducible protein OsmY
MGACRVKSLLLSLILVSSLVAGIGCSERTKPLYKAAVEKSLEQADLKGISVSEDVDKNTIKLEGTLHSDNAKTNAGDVAQSAAPGRTIANEISVQPVGAESEAKSESSALDDAIEKNYKAELIARRLNKQKIDYKSKNQVLTLTGSVKTTSERKEAEQIASKTPNVQQVVNQLEVR